LSQRIRKDIQIGENEVESPEKEELRSFPFSENSPAIFSPCLKDIPSPVSLVFTPVAPKKQSCWNCDAEMTHDHQCEAVESDSSCEDELDGYPTLDVESEDWAEKFSNSIRRFHGVNNSKVG
jgi:hypothetical protein